MPRIKKLFNFRESELKKKALELLVERGVTMDDLIELVLFLQKDYYPHISREMCLHNIERVLDKREIQNAIITGIQLDMLAEQKKLMSPLQQIIETDEGLYGIDEVLALSIVNVYGSIGFTNYGYIDKTKPGILEKLNDKESDETHTFLDDIVGAIAAAASSRLAHSQGK
ncbi:MAG: phosphatidylglycerophosphatase A [Bacillaceae bacterium]|nr:phosphatidylglycerophosphatase A [Bacillaceae bacterium]